MSNLVFMIGIVMLCKTINGLPWWAYTLAIAVGIIADLSIVTFKLTK